MTTYISPSSARYKNKTLLMNLSDKLFEAKTETVASGYDLALIFSEFSIYIELDPGLRFGVLEHSTGEMYGPYLTPLKIVQKHVFGVYDNLLGFLTNNISFDNDIGAYAIHLPGMYYYRGSYDLGSNLSRTSRDLKALLPRINRRFEYALGATTFFAEGSVEVFLNKLNLMYNIDTFKEDFKVGDLYSAGLVSRASGTAIEQSNGNRFFVLNASDRRHASYVIPKITTENFLSITSGSDSCDYIIDEYITNIDSIVETNESEVEYFKDSLGQDITEKTFEYKPLSLFDNIKLVLFPGDSVRVGYYFAKVSDDTIKIVKFDAFTKTMVVYDESIVSEINGLMTNGSVSIDGETITFIHNSIDFQAEGVPSVKISINDFKWATYPDINQILNEDGNIYSFQFAKNLLKTTFSGA